MEILGRRYQQHSRVVLATLTASPALRENGCKVLVLAVLVLQNSSLVLATTYSRQREGELFLTTVLVFLGECIKTCLSILCMVVTCGTSTGPVLHTSFVTEAHHLWRMAVPAVLYTFSNNLALVAMSNLSAVAYQVANQLKIPATALMARLLLQRRISPVQWCAILLLVLGVILVQLKPDAPPTARETHMVLGLAAVIANAVVGAFAGVWFEKIVKAAPPIPQSSCPTLTLQPRLARLTLTLTLTLTLNLALTLALTLTLTLTLTRTLARWSTLTLTLTLTLTNSSRRCGPMAARPH